MSRQTFLRSYVPSTRGAAAVVIVSFVDSLGTGLYLSGATLFLIRFAGISVFQVGVGLSIAGIAGLATAVPLGSLGDRVGARRLLVIMQAIRGVCFVGFAFVHGTPEYLVLSLFLGASEGPISALNQAVVGSVVATEHRVGTLAIVRSVRNVAFSVGALVSSPLLLIGTAWAYHSIMLVDAASFFVAAILLSRVPLLQHTVVKTKASLLRIVRDFGDGNFLALTGLNALFTIHMSLLLVAIPIWAVTAVGVSPAAVPLLVAINTVLAVVLQVPASRLAEGPRGGLFVLRLGILALTATCVALAAASVLSAGFAVAAVVIAMILLTLGEVWQSAGEWELSFRFAPEERRSLYLSVFSLGKATQSILGPILITAALLPAGILGWGVLGAVLLLSIPLVGIVVRRLSAGAIAK